MLALDAVSSSNGLYTDTTTWSHTCGSGTVLFVIAGMEGTGAFTATYGGALMTSLGSVRRSGEEYVEAFVLSNPPSGAHDLVLTASVYPAGGSVKACAWSFTGCDASNPARSPTMLGSIAETPTLTGIESAAGEIIIAGAVTNGEWFTGQGSGQTQDADLGTGNCFNACHKPGAASESISWVVVWETEFAAIALSVRAFTGVTEALTGSAAGVLALTGPMSLRLRASGSVAGVSSGSNALRAARKVSGSVAGAGAVSGSSAVRRKLGSQVSGSGTVTGGARLHSKIAGGVAALSDAAGMFGRKVAIAAGLVSDAAASAVLGVWTRIAGEAQSASTMSASARLSMELGSTIAGQAGAIGAISRLLALGGGAGSELQSAAALSLWLMVTGGVAHGAGVTGTLALIAWLSGGAAGAAFFAASLLVTNPLVALQGLAWATADIAGSLLRKVRGFGETNLRAAFSHAQPTVGAALREVHSSGIVSITGKGRMIRKWQ